MIFDKKGTDKIIYDRVLKMGLSRWLALLIVAQSRYETFSNGKPYNSKVCKENTNYFGYKYFKGSKYAISVGTQANAFDAQGNKDGGSYAKYATIEDSVSEVVDHLKRRISRDKQRFDLIDSFNISQYAILLKQGGYYGQTSTEYTKGMQSVSKDLI